MNKKLQLVVVVFEIISWDDYRIKGGPFSCALRGILYNYFNKKITGLRADPSPEPSEETRIGDSWMEGIKERENAHCTLVKKNQ